ncbi:hypothetical protein ACAF76_014170 [Brevibacillus sp. TJ4]|uniref:hypothetical protein n=1 Tax=Brevibacillus sp. TJ4 TaxID=3234853 RepID=UPI0037D4075F
MKQAILLISSILICFFGVYRLVTEPLSFIPVLFALCGGVGAIGAILRMRQPERYSR